MDRNAQESLFPESPQEAPTDPAAAAPVRALMPPQLLIYWQPWWKAVLQDIADEFRHQPPPPRLTSQPAPFWPDVFVQPRIEGRPFLLSALYHAAALAFLYLVPTLILLSLPGYVPEPPVTRTITYYKISEYLPEIRSSSEPAKVPMKGEPKYSRQPIVSLPMHPDNREQTVIDPSSVRILPQHVTLPNMAVMTPTLAPVPVQALTRAKPRLVFPLAAVTVVQPAPTTAQRRLAQMPIPNVPQPSVVEPPLTPETLKRKLGDINLARSNVQVEEPKMPVPEQRASGSTENSAATPSDKDVPAPPSMTALNGGKGSQAMGQLIALGLTPDVVQGPISVPGGERHGQFAATPEGKPDAPGTPDIKAGGAGSGGGGAPGPGGGSSSGASIPGLSVGAPPNGANVGNVSGGAVAQRPAKKPEPQVVAKVAPPKVPEAASAPESNERIEDRLFSGKKYYSLTLSMPNLTSATGSWIIRFAELGMKIAPGELTAPIAQQKVDPAYPPEVARDGVEGVVMLYAVIHSDGSVRDVRVLQGIDDRLDENARVALERWHFYPATKNGQPVDLEAVVRIPFKLRKNPF